MSHLEQLSANIITLKQIEFTSDINYYVVFFVVFIASLFASLPFNNEKKDKIGISFLISFVCLFANFGYNDVKHQSLSENNRVVLNNVKSSTGYYKGEDGSWVQDYISQSLLRNVIHEAEIKRNKLQKLQGMLNEIGFEANDSQLLALEGNF
jgi:hypothetical protein